VLVEVVRFTQKNGLKGSDGGWKDFSGQERQEVRRFSKRPQEADQGCAANVLKKIQKVGILVTRFCSFVCFRWRWVWFENSLLFYFQYFVKLVNRHMERSAIQQHMKMWPGEVSPEQVT
jgi:RNA exonuclease 1